MRRQSLLAAAGIVLCAAVGSSAVSAASPPGSLSVGGRAVLIGRVYVLQCDALAEGAVAATITISKCVATKNGKSARAPVLTFPGNVAATAAASLNGDFTDATVCMAATARFVNGKQVTTSRCF